MIRLYLAKAKYIRKFVDKNGKTQYVYNTPKTQSSKQSDKPLPAVGSHKMVENLGGSTGGAYRIKLKDGTEKVLKQSTGQKHIKEEYTANKIYDILNVAVPKVDLAVATNGQLTQVADYVPGRAMNVLSGAEYRRARKSLQQGFVADALLGNWDVVGLYAGDNIRWDGKKAWRIDNGGSLRFRAQGAPKGSAFGSLVGELDSLRNPQNTASEIFKDIPADEIHKQIAKVVKNRKRILSEIDDKELRGIMSKRIDNLKEFEKSVFEECTLIKSNDNRWQVFMDGKFMEFLFRGSLQKSTKDIFSKAYYSPDEVKARGMRWVTIRGARVLLQGTSDGGYVVVGGAGGKLNHLKIKNVLSEGEYEKKRESFNQKKKEETQNLTEKDIEAAKEVQREKVKKQKAARESYTQAVTSILGVSVDELKSKISSDDMKNITDRARDMIENRKSTATMTPDRVDKEVSKQIDKEVKKEIQKEVKSIERQALEALVHDYLPEDPNVQKDVNELLNTDKAMEILAARKQFKKELKEIGKQTADIPTDLKVGSVFVGATKEDVKSIQDEVSQQIEIQQNIEMYDLLNAQSSSIKKHIDQGAASAFNGLIGDLYGAGATFTKDTIDALGIEGIAQALVMKVQKDGNAGAVSKALNKYVEKERGATISKALKETKRRLANAESLRNLARDTDDAEAILSMASANGHALSQVTAAQRELGTAAGSLQAAAHLINTFDEAPADTIQVDAGKDLFRAKDRAIKAGLKPGSFDIKKGKGNRYVIEISKDSIDSFFQNQVDNTEQINRIDQIKRYEFNKGYKPEGIKGNIKFDKAQEAGLHFFKEKGNVLLDFEAGLGKTGIAYAAMMEAMNNKGAKKILVVTPSSTRGDFYSQKDTFLTDDMQKLVSQSTANTSKADRQKRHFADEGIHIVSQDSLRADADILKNAGYDMIVVDEIHEMTAGSGKSGRYRALETLSDVPLKVAMSGTNIKNSKAELYRKIDFIEPNHGLGSMSDFEKRYKGLNQGTGLFQEASNDAFRRDISDFVYTQKNSLPITNTLENVMVPLSAEQRTAYRKSEETYRAERDQKKSGASARRDARNYSIIQNGDANTNKKAEKIIDIMKNHEGEKAVIHVSQTGKPVLSAMKTMQAKLQSTYSPDAVATIHGGSSPAELDRIKARFNDPQDPLRFIIGTKSLESGHNLQSGGTVNFHFDVPESKAAQEQREARTYRKGQDTDVKSYLLGGDNPLDIRAEDSLARKAKEQGIMGSTRSVLSNDETGFIGMLNAVEQDEREKANA